MQMIFNAFFKDFPLDCQKYMYHQKTRTSAFGQPIERFIFGCHRYFFVTFREKNTYFYHNSIPFHNAT